MTWSGDTTLFGLVRDENEVFGQGLDNAGTEVGADDFPISSMGPDGSAQFGVGAQQFTGPLAYAPDRDRFLVVWNGDNGPPLVDNEIEAFGRMVSTSVPPPPLRRPRRCRRRRPRSARGSCRTSSRCSRPSSARAAAFAATCTGSRGSRTCPTATVVTLRCETRCKLSRSASSCAQRGKKKKTSLTLRKRVAVTQNSRVRVTARHDGYVSRWIRYPFVRKKLGITARRVGSGCQTLKAGAQHPLHLTAAAGQAAGQRTVRRGRWLAKQPDLTRRANVPDEVLRKR